MRFDSWGRSFSASARTIESRGAMKNIGGRQTGRLDITHLDGIDVMQVYEIPRAEFASGLLARSADF
jgi:hypothetical protein